MIAFRFIMTALAGILVASALLLQPNGAGSPTGAPSVALAAASAGDPAGMPEAQDPEPLASRDRANDRKRAGAESGDCPGGLEPVPGTEFCTHGPDPVPPGLENAGPARPMQARAARRVTSDFTCDGDGRSGYRVQVLYVRAENAPDRFSEFLPSIRAWTAGADEIMQESAAATGGSRRFRFVTDNCQIDVQPVVLLEADVTNFGRMIRALEAKGFSRSDRYYLSFVDLERSTYCGIATYWEDDRAGANNLNNSGPGYSRVDPTYGCWDEEVVAHELMHNLGGVQPSAPHSTPYGHCIDDWDVMCYEDDPTTRLQTICRDENLEARYDCRNDDYFHTHPPAGSYLDTHWNTANNRFLISGQDDAGNDTDSTTGGESDSPTVTITSPKRGARPKGKKRISVAAAAQDDTGVAFVEFRRCRGNSCSWEEASTIGSDTAAPFSQQWKLPKRGQFTFLARATDQQGNEAFSDPVTIRIEKEKRKKRH